MAARQDGGLSARMSFLLAGACGLIVANIYYAQPLINLIAPAIGLGAPFASLIVTLTQMGYGIGMVLLVPLGDLVENRNLVIWTLAGASIALAVAALANSYPWFLAASLLIGMGSVAVQMLIPIAAHLASDTSRGRVVGNVVGGLLVGIMLARPVASLVANAFGWRVVFGASATLMVPLGFLLYRSLPRRRPSADHTYLELIGSLWTLVRDTPLLRRRALYQAALFAAFSLYWTAVPLLLSSPIFGFTQRGIALFALAGAAGALSAPIAGRLADSGQTRAATAAALSLAAAAFPLSYFGGKGSLSALLAGGILLDLGVQANLVLGQRAIYSLGAHVRSRLNGLYLAIFFTGGAIGSSIASIVFTRGGWGLLSAIGIAFPLAALIYCTRER